jgi:tripeptide aminopeptidase
MPKISVKSWRRKSVNTLLELLPIPGVSGEEECVVNYLRKQLRRLNIPAADIYVDDAHRKSALGGNIGNLIVRLAATLPGASRMFVAHLDTVPGCLGSVPVLKDGMICSGKSTMGLGADNRTGVAVLLNTIREIVENSIPHPPLTFLFTVQEERGQLGVRHIAIELLGAPTLSFNFDGGKAEKLTIGSVGADRLDIELTGIGAHAGLRPEKGASAIVAAGKAIADLQDKALLGAISYRNKSLTTNIGIIAGGSAVNVVPEHVMLKAEVRGYDRELRTSIVSIFKSAFDQAAAAICNVDKQAVRSEAQSRTDYEAFSLTDSEPCVVEAERAVRSAGLRPFRAVANGGTDANWLFVHGIPTVSFGAGQVASHSYEEAVDIKEFEKACRIALLLATTI